MMESLTPFLAFLTSPTLLLLICCVSGLVSVLLFLRSGTTTRRLGIVLTVAGMVALSLHMLRPYYPPLDALFTSLPTLESLRSTVTPLITFVQDNLYGMAMGALTIAGVAMKVISSIRKTAEEKLHLVTAQATEDVGTLQQQLGILSTDKLTAEAQADDAVNQLVALTTKYDLQTQQLTNLQTEYGKLKAALASIEASV